MKLAYISGKKRRNIRKLKLRNLKLTVSSNISWTCTAPSLTLRWDYQPRTNIVKDDKGDLVTDSHSILARWRNHFSYLLNVYGVNAGGHKEIHPAEPKP